MVDRVFKCLYCRNMMIKKGIISPIHWNMVWHTSFIFGSRRFVSYQCIIRDLFMAFKWIHLQHDISIEVLPMTCIYVNIFCSVCKINVFSWHPTCFRYFQYRKVHSYFILFYRALQNHNIRHCLQVGAAKRATRILMGVTCFFTIRLPYEQLIFRSC